MAKNNTPNQSSGKHNSSAEQSQNEANATEHEAYEELLDQLKDEKTRLERDLRHDYRNARRYVRAHPEEGIGLALITGAAIGFIIGKLTRR